MIYASLLVKKQNMSCLEAFSWLTGVFDLLYQRRFHPLSWHERRGSFTPSTHGIHRKSGELHSQMTLKHQLYQPLKHLVMHLVPSGEHTKSY